MMGAYKYEGGESATQCNCHACSCQFVYGVGIRSIGVEGVVTRVSVVCLCELTPEARAGRYRGGSGAW